MHSAAFVAWVSETANSSFQPCKAALVVGFSPFLVCMRKNGKMTMRMRIDD